METTADQTWYYESGGERKGPVSSMNIEELAKQGKVTRNTLVWQEGQTAWQPIIETSLKSLFLAEPPPLHGGAVKSYLSWMLALTPIIGPFAGVFLFGIKLYALQLLCSILVAGIVFTSMDIRVLRSAGYSISYTGILWPPIYLYKRSKLLKQNHAQLIVWCVTFLAVLFL